MKEESTPGSPGKQVRMVDVGDKPETRRASVARAVIRMAPATFKLLKSDSLPKGNVLATAQVAGITAAKKTSDIIPLCHPLLIDHVDVEFEMDESRSEVTVKARVSCTGRTGVEMEALTAAAAGALTIYDMCKAVDAGMVIESIRLLHKSGGKSGAVDFPATR